MWEPTAAAARAAATAPRHPVPPSHQQEEYLRCALRNTDTSYRFSRLCLMAFDLPGTLNEQAMTTAFTLFLRRHDCFHSWFAANETGSLMRHMLTTDNIELRAGAPCDFDSPDEIRIHIQNETPGPFTWDCFRFGTIQRDGGFTVFAAVDHLDTDGISQAITCVDLMTLYQQIDAGVEPELPRVGSYLDYCRRERQTSASLTRSSPEVQEWIDLVSANAGQLPRFPLDLGTEGAGTARSAHLTTTIFDEESAKSFERTCRSAKSNMTAAALAVAALAYGEFTGENQYLGLTPKSTRELGPELRSVGWFTSLIPVPIELGEDPCFTTIAPLAATSYKAGKKLTDVSFHRVLELSTTDDDLDVTPGWSVPMVSYVDVRRLPGVDVFDAINGCLYGNRGSSEEVFIWINRFADATSISLLFPDTPEAHRSIKLYVERIVEIFTTVAATGDYRAPTGRLTIQDPPTLS